MKLEGASNYIVWAFKFKQIVLREKIWTVVDPAGFSSTRGTLTSLTGPDGVSQTAHR